MPKGKGPDTQGGSLQERLVQAHYAYFSQLDQEWTGMQQRLQTEQLQYQPALMRASMTQTPADMQTAMQGLQQMSQMAFSDDQMTRAGQEAYSAYLSAVGEAMSGASAETLDPATLAALAQSIAAVAATHAQMTPVAGMQGMPDTPEAGLA